MFLKFLLIAGAGPLFQFILAQRALPRYYPKQKEYKIEDLILESNMEDWEGRITGQNVTHIVMLAYQYYIYIIYIYICNHHNDWI